MLFFKKKPREQLDIPREEGEHELRYVQKNTTDEEGKGKITHIIGEKHPLRGQPTGERLGLLEPVKALLDKILTSRLPDLIIHEIPYNELSQPVRVFYDVLGDLIEAEKLEGHKKRWRKTRKFLCFFLENDFPYRYKWQWIMERLAKRINEIKLDESDKFHFRVKNFRVDLEEEWKEALQAYPQLKERMDEFKEFIKIGWNGGDDRGKNDSIKLESLSEIAKKFLEIKQ